MFIFMHKALQSLITFSICWMTGLFACVVMLLRWLVVMSLQKPSTSFVPFEIGFVLTAELTTHGYRSISPN